MDYNCISYWFPKLNDSGVKVPHTHMICAPGSAYNALDVGMAGFDDWVRLIGLAAKDLGFPAFFRLGNSSGKHDWSDCCVIESDDPKHVAQVVVSTIDDSGCKDLPAQVAAIRQMIPTTPMFTAFRGMPITREFRCFVDCTNEFRYTKSEFMVGDKMRSIAAPDLYQSATVTHIQPYWPADSLEGHVIGCADWLTPLMAASVLTAEEWEQIETMVCQAGREFSGSWSIDVLQDRDGGWWITDMAQGERSFRWTPEFEVLPPGITVPTPHEPTQAGASANSGSRPKTNKRPPTPKEQSHE
jgi:hypothetical protein